MLARVNIEDKTMGNKHLLHDLQFMIADGEKIGVIGRNGVGKTTLFNVLAGSDTEFEGSIDKKKNLRMVATAQEHHDLKDISAVEYILERLPHYSELKNIIDTYPETMGDDMKKIHKYSEALDLFGQKGFYNVDDLILDTLDKYQIDNRKANMPMKGLSGGQKRFVELVLVQFSDTELALIDEPTNHMDYVAKNAFIKWLEEAKHACLIITHDRDVLAKVDRIIELKDKKTVSYNGNYEAYLKQNTVSTTNQMQSYEIAQRTMTNIKKQIEHARAMKPSWGGTADKKNPFVVMEERLTRELKRLEAENQKPSFWIDKESAKSLNPKTTANYEKYKAKNIKITKHTDGERSTNLLTITNLELGYSNESLFKPLSLSLQTGERIHIAGRNGAGKTTLVNAISNAVQDKNIATLISGKIYPGHHVRLNRYEQEIQDNYLKLSLYDAIENIYRDFGLPINPQTIMRNMGDYLFDPAIDAQIPVAQLSGGQKARLQLIRMLANKPNLLILDEPTNHLDLPSIEELENALIPYHGAIIYISHDSYFAHKLGGDQIEIKKT